MVVDDAGTLPKGGGKLELAWVKDDRTRQWETAAGFSPIDHLEVEIGFSHGRDTASSPDTRLQGLGLAVKWVPIQAEQGLSAGLRFEKGRTRVDTRLDPEFSEHDRALQGLLTWTFENTTRLHVNLGRSWLRSTDEKSAVNTWGLGLDQPLLANINLTLEIFGEEHQQPDRQLGLRWTVVEGLKLSVATGQGNHRRFGSAGLAWEF